LPSSSHEMLYRRLQGIAADTRSALMQNDFEKLLRITAAHQQITAALKGAGDCMDTDSLSLLIQTRDDICAVEQEVEKRSTELRGLLKVSGNKRKIAKAYGV
jgi:hypothetical protein